MLTLYLTSIVIFMIIISCECFIFEQSIRDNGWIEPTTVKGNSFVALFCISAIPIVRILMVGVILYMATVKKEDFEKYKEDDDSE